MPRSKSRLEVELDQLTGKGETESELDLAPKNAPEEKKVPDKIEDEFGHMIVLAGPGGEKLYDERSPASFVQDMLDKKVDAAGILAVARAIRNGQWYGKVKTLLEANGIELPKPKKKGEDDEDDEGEDDDVEPEDDEDE